MNNIQQPTLIWDEAGQPKSEQFDDIYFSKNDGLEESRHVFLKNNFLEQRWQKLFSDNHPNSRFCIAETGFGTGLNFLAAWSLWNRISNDATENATLHFISVEKFPLCKADLTVALSHWTELSVLSNQLIEQYPSPIEHRVNRLNFNCGKVKLTLIFADVIEGLMELVPSLLCADKVRESGIGVSPTPFYINAWFLDGFAPAKNPDMWTQPLFDIMAKLSDATTTAATFTAAGDVRRGLSEAGFSVNKVAGHGTKRHMLVAQFTSKPAARINTTSEFTGLASKKWAKTDLVRATRQLARSFELSAPSWHLTPRSLKSVKTIAVIGAGLAGAHTAFALAERGFSVTVFEANTIASGASGNPQGVVYTRFSHQNDALAQFNSQALYFADTFYRNDFYEKIKSHCGVLHVSSSAEQFNTQKLIANRFAQNPRIAKMLNPAQSQQKSGINSAVDGLFTEFGGWLRPVILCQQLLSHPSIKVIEQTPITALEKTATASATTWILRATEKQKFFADLVVIANAYKANEFEQSRHLMLKAIRGQMSYGELADNHGFNLITCLCGDGYVAPPIALDNGKLQLSFGATFDINNQNKAISEHDSQSNLERLKQLIKPQSLPQLQNVSARVSFRCATRDYLPIIGPVCDATATCAAFGAYRNNKYSVVDSPGHYHQGLFINVGHGSRGLAYTPLSAEIIASTICGEPLPVDMKLYKQLHPARFLIRDLNRGII
jgi:tRNA 5-methylaminomethyl-2-thiouridine biosynthesis bifunctional protein